MPNSTSSKPHDARPRGAWFYATKPTRFTLFLRTFLPWQIWRFLVINTKMVGMIRKSHSHGSAGAHRR